MLLLPCWILVRRTLNGIRLFGLILMQRTLSTGCPKCVTITVLMVTLCRRSKIASWSTRSTWLISTCETVGVRNRRQHKWRPQQSGRSEGGLQVWRNFRMKKMSLSRQLCNILVQHLCRMSLPCTWIVNGIHLKKRLILPWPGGV